MAARASRLGNQDAIDFVIVAILPDPKEARVGIEEVHFLPFNPTDKRTALTYLDAEGKMHRVSKGAPEQMPPPPPSSLLPARNGSGTAPSSLLPARDGRAGRRPSSSCAKRRHGSRIWPPPPPSSPRATAGPSAAPPSCAKHRHGSRIWRAPSSLLPPPRARRQGLPSARSRPAHLPSARAGRPVEARGTGRLPSKLLDGAGARPGWHPSVPPPAA